jgi:hypothetical protein
MDRVQGPQLRQSPVGIDSPSPDSTMSRPDNQDADLRNYLPNIQGSLLLPSHQMAVPVLSTTGRRQTPSASHESPAILYSRLLASQSPGIPLFIPEPDEDLPKEYRSQGVMIGDVGVITPDGAFDFYFNACAHANDPINFNGVPRNFRPIKLKPSNVSTRPYALPRGHVISSSSVQKRSLALDDSLKKDAYVSFHL